MHTNRISSSGVKFCDPETEQSFLDFIATHSARIRHANEGLSVFWLIVCLALGTTNLFYATLLFTGWLYSRLGLRFFEVLMAASITAYGYIAYSLVMQPGVPVTLEAVCLASVNLLSLILRHKLEITARLFFLRYHKLKRQAAFDELTGLYHCRHILELGAKMFDRCLRQECAFSILMVDVDGFKRINTDYGHKAGDLALIELAVVLRQSIRNQDFCGRYDGDGFLVLLPDTSLATARLTAVRIAETLSRHEVGYREETFSATVSIGAAAITGQTLELTDLIALAGRALCRAKAQGGNRVNLWDAAPGVEETAPLLGY